jgi:hypothetical protein
MSSIFVLCRLLHAELEEILFTRFIFLFPLYTRLATVQHFTTTISPRACTLLREITVGICFRLSCDGEEFTRKDKGNEPLPVQEALIHLKKELPGLKKAYLNVEFVRRPPGDILVKRRVDEYANVVIGLVMIIAPGIEVVVTNNDHEQVRKEIMPAYCEKVEELMKSSKAKELVRI